jgi:cellulose synthase/poly-beta-1,6-N-acetylglucosamine synthase-like glycosyltransferase
MVKQLRYLRYTIETILVNALVFSTLYQLLVYLANRRFWRQSPPPPVETVPSISVVVPLHGKSPDTLAQLHLLAITRPTDHYEVIPVLESEQDPAYPAAQAVARSYPQVIRVVTSGPAGSHAVGMHALNAGYQAAHGDLVAFVEAHVQVSAELWSAALAVLADPGIGAAYALPLASEPEHRGSSRFPTGGEMLTALYINHAQTAELPFAALGNRVQELSGGFMIVRRQVLQDMGGLLHLLDQAAEDISLGRAVREIGYRLAAIPVPARVMLEPETFNEATHHLQRVLMIRRACRPAAYLAQPFTNPLTVGFLLGFITEREGRRWGRRTWWIFVWLRMAIAYELDRVRFGRGFTWIAYAQLFMLDTFIAPALWARALIQRTFTWHGRTYRIAQGGKVSPLEDG